MAPRLARCKYPELLEEHPIATIPEIEARIHALWVKGDARTPDESAEFGQLLTALETVMPPGEFYTHVLEVLHIPARDAQRFMVGCPLICYTDLDTSFCKILG